VQQGGPYGLRMGLTGLIFAAIAVAWLAYLIPVYLRRRSPAIVEGEDPANQFSDSMRIVRHGTAPLVDVDGAEISSVEVSTPLTRRAAIGDLHRLQARAAARRRRVLVVLALALTAVLGGCAAKLVDWFWVAVPGGLMLGFFIVARFSVRAMRRHLDDRFDEINAGGDESTIFMKRADLAAVVNGRPKPSGKESAEQTATVTRPITGALWDPLPITLPTYVSKPLAPRTVRTIDLSGPDVTSSARSSTPGTQVPVTADAPEPALGKDHHAVEAQITPTSASRAAGA